MNDNSVGVCDMHNKFSHRNWLLPRNEAWNLNNTNGWMEITSRESDEI